jgi:hypothetical protein
MMYQLRIYTINRGEMAEWLSEWIAHIVPLRRRHGFEVMGAWTIVEADRFVWVLSYAGSKSWEEADSDYYESAERAAIEPDPARHIAKSEQWLMSPISHA